MTLGNTSKLTGTVHSLCGVALAVEAVLELEAEGTVLACVLDPGAGDHPDGTGRALAADHQKHRPARTVERRVGEVPLQTRHVSAGGTGGAGNDAASGYDSTIQSERAGVVIMSLCR